MRIPTEEQQKALTYMINHQYWSSTKAVTPNWLSRLCKNYVQIKVLGSFMQISWNLYHSAEKGPRSLLIKYRNLSDNHYWHLTTFSYVKPFKMYTIKKSGRDQLIQLPIATVNASNKI